MTPNKIDSLRQKIPILERQVTDTQAGVREVEAKIPPAVEREKALAIQLETVADFDTERETKSDLYAARKALTGLRSDLAQAKAAAERTTSQLNQARSDLHVAERTAAIADFDTALGNTLEFLYQAEAAIGPLTAKHKLLRQTYPDLGAQLPDPAWLANLFTALGDWWSFKRAVAGYRRDFLHDDDPLIKHLDEERAALAAASTRYVNPGHKVFEQ